jgi:hypothetical protein
VDQRLIKITYFYGSHAFVLVVTQYSCPYFIIFLPLQYTLVTIYYVYFFHSFSIT